MIQKIIQKILIITIIATGLGVAFSPLSSDAVDYTCTDTGETSASCDVDVEVLVAPYVSMSICDGDKCSDDEGAEDPFVISSTGVIGTDVEKSFTANVTTNTKAGYSLTIEDTDSTTALTHVSHTDISIPADDGFDCEGSCWSVKSSYAGTNSATALANYSAVPAHGATPLVLLNYTAASDDYIIRDPTTITVGTRLSSSQAAGVYQDAVYITATTK